MRNSFRLLTHFSEHILVTRSYFRLWETQKCTRERSIFSWDLHSGRRGDRRYRRNGEGNVRLCRVPGDRKQGERVGVNSELSYMGSQVWGQLTLPLGNRWLHMHCFQLQQHCNQSQLGTEQAAHHWKSSMKVSLKRHNGKKPTLRPSWGEKETSPETLRKPTKTRHCVFKREQNYSVTELLSYIPMGQNKTHDIKTKQQKGTKNYLRLYTVTIPSWWGEGLVGGILVFKWFYFFVFILPFKKNRQFQYLGNLLNHKIHLQK